MALTKEYYDELFVDRDGCISVRRSNIVLEDGVEIAKTFHRKVFEPGDSVTAEGNVTKAVAGVVWTQEVIDKHAAKKAAAIDKLPK